MTRSHAETRSLRSTLKGSSVGVLGGTLLVAVGIAGLVSFTLSNDASAQTMVVPGTAPKSLTGDLQPGQQPGQQPGAVGPLQLVPLDLSDELDDPEEPEEIRSGIAVQNLQRIDPESVGVLDAGTGGYPVGMWTGTPRHRIDVLMQRLPTAPVSAVQLDITRRLLLSRAAVPLGPEADLPAASSATVPSSGGVSTAQSALQQSDITTGEGQPNAFKTGPQSKSLLDIRLKALFNLGLLQDLDALIQAAPSRVGDPDVQRLQLETRLLRDDLPGACGLTSNVPQSDHFWLKASVFCQAVAGDSAGADFGATLIREESNPDDLPYLNLLDRVLGANPPPLESLGEPDALETAMVKVTEQDWPEDAAAKAGPAVQRIIALSPSADPVARLAAAEELVVSGRLSPDSLSALYAELQFESQMLSTALSGAEETGGPLGRALIYQAALAQENSVARAELLSKAYDIAALEGQVPLLNKVFLPLVSSIPPQRELWWLANNAARALYSAGAMDQARLWADTLRSAARHDPVAAEDAIRLWAIARLAGDRVLDRLGRNTMDKWRDLQLATAPDAAVHRITLFYALSEALGDLVPDTSWEELLLNAKPEHRLLPNASVSRALNEAAGGLRQGETILLSMVMLGDGGPGFAAPQTMGSIVQGLSAVGLPQDARSLALDAALRAGI